jgi:hypothetical protein
LNCRRGTGALASAGGELRLHRGLLKLHAEAAMPLPACAGEPGPEPIRQHARARLGRVRGLPADRPRGVEPAQLHRVIVRPARQGGERFSLAPRASARSLKKQFQALACPRGNVGGPLLFTRDGHLLFVPGLGVERRFQAPPGVPSCACPGCPPYRQSRQAARQRPARIRRFVQGSKEQRTTMALIVHKYGGTSMGSTERIRSVAQRVAKWVRAGHQMVVVPSAMSGETNRLLGLAKELMPNASTPEALRELDAIAATGEQVSVGLLALALQAQGVPGQSATAAGRCRSRPIRPTPRPASAASTTSACAPTWPRQGGHHHRLPGHRPAGQRHHAGPRRQRHQAVAVAAALKADECLIYTDVDGVYTTDPRIVPEARRLKTISFEEMLEMASLGSKVLQIRSVEFAGKYRVPLRVLSSFTPWDIDIAEEAKLGHPDHL